MKGRIADRDYGVIWTSSELIDNGDGTYSITMNKELFKDGNNIGLTNIPDTVYITMYVREELLELIDDLSILIKNMEL